MRAASSPPPRVVVLGGNGFVGSAVCRAALRRLGGAGAAAGDGGDGQRVASVSRSGAPAHAEAWTESVAWHVADASDAEQLAPLLPAGPRSAVISCVGAFGSNAHMERACGDVTIAAAKAAAAAGTEHFVFVSVHDFAFPEAFVRRFGYLNGKRRAEAAVKEHFPDGRGVIVRPGAVYGNRKVYPPGGGVLEVPLPWVFRPLARSLGGRAADWRAKRRAMAGGLAPGPLATLAELSLTAPVSVEALGESCVAAAMGDLDAELDPAAPIVDEVRLAQFDAAADFGRAW